MRAERGEVAGFVGRLWLRLTAAVIIMRIMATRAEQARAKAERDAKPPEPKKPRPPRRDDPVDTAKPGVSATDRKVGAGSTAKRNASKRAARKGGAVLEDSATGKPSRKSTRKTAPGTTATSNLARRQTRRASSPETRAAQAAAKRTKA